MTIKQILSILKIKQTDLSDSQYQELCNFVDKITVNNIIPAHSYIIGTVKQQINFDLTDLFDK